MKTELDERGNLSINVIDLFEQMDEEQKQTLVEHFAWHSPIWAELVQAVQDEYAAENFNSNLYKMRLEFFQSDSVPEQLRYTIKSLLNTILHLRQRERAYTNALGQWRKWYLERYQNGEPVPFPRCDLEFTGSDALKAFMERNGLIDILEQMPE